MDNLPDDPAVATQHRGLGTLILFGVLGGLLTGVVGGAFRWTLIRADDARVAVVDWARQWPIAGVLVPVALAAVAVALARLLVRYVPEAAGSGVQRVEAAMRGAVPLERLRVLPVKFVGGVLAIGSGLALGREGPTVQMGASIGGALGKRLPHEGDDRVLEAGLSGAGLAVAFSAPLGGSIFVFEELTKKVTVRLVATTLVGAGVAVTVSAYIIGQRQEFNLGQIPDWRAVELLPYALLGLLIGGAAAYYNRTVVWFLDFLARFRRLRPEVTAAIVGGLVGAVAFFFPTAVGGGDGITQATFDARPGLLTLVALLIFRWFLGPLSYAVGTPGGLFAPLLTVGALSGAVFALALQPLFSVSVASFAFVGMAAFFAGVVRAPLTGIVITAEMAATVELVVPAMVAATLSVVAAIAMKSEPIYDTLRARIPPDSKLPDRWH